MTFFWSDAGFRAYKSELRRSMEGYIFTPRQAVELIEVIRERVRMEGSCTGYQPIDTGGWCFNCGKQKSKHGQRERKEG